MARLTLQPPPDMGLAEWADTYRQVAGKTSASPGQWRTSSQPIAFGPMAAFTDPETATVSIMAGTQVVKTEFLINVACYSIHLDPSSILFVQPTQGAAEAFSKERFQPTIDVTPELARLIAKPRARNSENTIGHKAFRGGSLDFVGSNSPTDLASRPKRIILCDEIDKYPASAGGEGDPLKLAEERASTYHAVGRAKFVRTCSPTDEDTSRIGREYRVSDQRKCFVACPHCGHEQALTWANVVWEKNEAGEHRPATAAIRCAGPDCGTIWSERDRESALDALALAPDHGWRQTKPFVCCGERQEPTLWDSAGRSLCSACGERSEYDGHAGFHVSKLYSKRHRLRDIVKEFVDAQGDPELLKKFFNTALAELWKPAGREEFKHEGLLARAENYGPDDLPNEVRVITGFCDVQGDRLEVQLVGWGSDEESWPFLYEVIHQDPAQPAAWRELDTLLRRRFKTRDGRIFGVAAVGVDHGGHHAAQVEAFCHARRGRRIFATKGSAGSRPLWPMQASKTKTNKPLWIIGVDAGKDAIFGRLKIPEPEPGRRRPGFIHFPAAENFGPDYFEQLTRSERRETRKKMGRPYAVWVQISNKRNEALDTMVGALAVRRSLPKRIEAGLQFSIAPVASADDRALGQESPTEPPPPPRPRPAPVAQRSPFLGRHKGWIR